MPGRRLVGTQLSLRPLSRPDARALGAILRDRRVTRYLPPWVRRASGEEFVARVLAVQRRREGVAFAVVPIGSSTAVGQVRLFQWSREHGDAEIGYWLRRSNWGRGWATEAVWLACHYGFRVMRLRRIEALVLDGNDASARVLRKLGFRLEGRSRQSERLGRGWVDELRFGLLTGELRRPPRRGGLPRDGGR